LLQGLTLQVLRKTGWVPLSEAANTFSLIRALTGHSRVHVVVLNDGAGVRWGLLFRALADQPGGAPRVRVSVVGLSRGEQPGAAGPSALELKIQVGAREEDTTHGRA
jgi:hypothetical protein